MKWTSSSKMGQLWKTSEYACRFVTMKGKLPECSNREFSDNQALSFPKGSKRCQIFICNSFGRQKTFVPVQQVSIPGCCIQQEMPSIPVSMLYPPFSSTCQMKCSKSFPFSTTSLCKALEKQADRSKAGSFALLEEYLSCQHSRQNRTSWFQIKASCCCCLALLYHILLWLEHLLTGRIQGPC